MRPEDRNARQSQRAFAEGATLGELEEHIAFLRSLGAPGDAHPKISIKPSAPRSHNGGTIRSAEAHR